MGLVNGPGLSPLGKQGGKRVNLNLSEMIVFTQISGAIVTWQLLVSPYDVIKGAELKKPHKHIGISTTH